MNWKDVVVGAVATLVVTVLGGVAVYYVTREPDDKRSERLLYTVTDPASFKGASQDLSFRTIRLTNAGGVAAKHVTLSVNFKMAEVRDLSVEANAGMKEISRAIAPQSLQLVYAVLLPNETISLSLLLTSEEDPKIDIRSESSLARKGRLVDEPTPLFPRRDKIVNLIGLIAALIGTLGFYFLRRNNYFGGASKNNTGFLLLHQGMYSKANDIFEAAINNGDHDSLTLSNFSVCRAVHSDFATAEQLLRAAKFNFRGAARLQAILEFNEALILLLKKQEAEGFKLLRRALEKSRGTIKSYIEYSVLLEPHRNDERYLEVFNTMQK